MELVKAGAFLQEKWSQCNVTSQNYYSKHICISKNEIHVYVECLQIVSKLFQAELHREIVIT